jgi:hypothetical protein
MIREAHLDAAFGGVQKLLCAAVLSTVALAPAHAALIDFEGNFGGVGHNEFIVEDGYQVLFYSTSSLAGPGDLVGAFIDGTDAESCIGGSCPVNNPGTYYGVLDDGVIDIVRIDGGAFRVGSFDAGFIGGTAPGTTYPTTPGLVRIQGWYANGASVSETYSLQGQVNNAFYFNHFNTTATFAAQQFVEIAIFGFACNTAGSCTAFNTDRGQFGIDNIALVPEPGSALLVGLGLAGLMGASRRRKA